MEFSFTHLFNLWNIFQGFFDTKKTECRNFGFYIVNMHYVVLFSLHKRTNPLYVKYTFLKI